MHDSQKNQSIEMHHSEHPQCKGEYNGMQYKDLTGCAPMEFNAAFAIQTKMNNLNISNKTRY